MRQILQLANAQVLVTIFATDCLCTAVWLNCLAGSGSL